MSLGMVSDVLDLLVLRQQSEALVRLAWSLIDCIRAGTCAHVQYIHEAAQEKVTALGVLCCFALFVCLTLLASFFHLSFKNM